ncbi:hypothetical protein Sjap_023579 [Stephania japonica]|uniref:Ricin B lectin domain-containing protein n=1 Tax=Stephania japonica TaxID=461633 RepID=A0AAP0HMU5_9MAGN
MGGMAIGQMGQMRKAQWFDDANLGKVENELQGPKEVEPKDDKRNTMKIKWSAIVAVWICWITIQSHQIWSSTSDPDSTTSFASHLDLIKQHPNNYLGVVEHPDEPIRTRIRGRNGLCVDVEGFVYRDNTPIILFPCRTYDILSQLWRLTKEGRIYSQEKCLAASGTTSGSAVVIHECETIDKSAIIWEMLDDGTLINAHSRLAVTAKSGSAGSELTLEENDSSTFQAWNFTNNLNPVQFYIRGENDQCISYDGNSTVYTDYFGKWTTKWTLKQEWILYPDRTIRPKDRLDRCMEITRLPVDLTEVPIEVAIEKVQVGDCNQSPVLQRWILGHTGPIMHFKSRLVVDASTTYPGCLDARPFYYGRGNQLWLLDYIV